MNLAVTLEPVGQVLRCFFNGMLLFTH